MAKWCSFWRRTTKCGFCSTSIRSSTISPYRRALFLYIWDEIGSVRCVSYLKTGMNFDSSKNVIFLTIVIYTNNTQFET